MHTPVSPTLWKEGISYEIEYCGSKKRNKGSHSGIFDTQFVVHGASRCETILKPEAEQVRPGNVNQSLPRLSSPFCSALLYFRKTDLESLSKFNIG